MKENFKYITKLSAIAVSSFLKINILGALSTVAAIVIEFFLLTKNINSGHSGHVSAIPFLSMTFLARPVGSILWYLTCIASPFLFFVLGNKYILTKIANRLINDKSESLINPIIDRALLKVKTRQPEVLRTIGDFSLNKLKIIQEVKNDRTENMWLRRIIILGMEKISLNEVDFSEDNQSFYEIIKVKVLNILNNISEPSRNSIWILIAIQWIIVAFIWLTKY